MIVDPSQPYNLPALVVALFVLRALVGLIGIIFNLDLVYIICANRSLHSSCSLLLALHALCEALYEFSFITNAIIVAGLTSGSGDQLCGINDLYIGNLANEIVRNNIIWNMLTVVCYLAVWIVLKQRKTNAATDHATRRLFMSLFFTMVLNFFGWFIYSMFFLALTYFITLDIVQLFCVGGSLAIVMALASLSCPPLLYTFSRDYRRAFQRQFWTIGRSIGLNASYFAASKDNSHVIINVRMSPSVMINHSELRSSSHNGNRNH